MERKLTAILCADVYGYSRLMGEDEAATLRTLSAYRKIIDGLIENHQGRFVNSAGDSVLAEFTSVVEAVNCAVGIQVALKTENEALPLNRRMEFRIGVNSGDVTVLVRASSTSMSSSRNGKYNRSGKRRYIILSRRSGVLVECDR